MFSDFKMDCRVCKNTGEFSKNVRGKKISEAIKEMYGVNVVEEGAEQSSKICNTCYMNILVR